MRYGYMFLSFSYGTVYLAEMMMLEDTHPDVFNQLTTVQGSWTYQRNSSSGFNGLAADQTIETTINRETKISGGVTGFTKKAGMFCRCSLKRNNRYHDGKQLEVISTYVDRLCCNIREFSSNISSFLSS